MDGELSLREWLERFLNPENHGIAVAREKFGIQDTPDFVRAQARGQIASDFEAAIDAALAAARARAMREALEHAADNPPPTEEMQEAWTNLNDSGAVRGARVATIAERWVQQRLAALAGPATGGERRGGDG